MTKAPIGRLVGIFEGWSQQSLSTQQSLLLSLSRFNPEGLSPPHGEPDSVLPRFEGANNW